MSKIYFEKNYILIKPSYKQTNEHKHNMLHLFVGKSMLTLSCEKGEVCGRVIALDKDIKHRAPEGELDYFLFIDPTTELAGKIKTEFMKEMGVFSWDDDSLYLGKDFSPDMVKSRLSHFFGEDELEKNNNIDKRITEIMNRIDSFDFRGKRVSDLAAEYGYSESYLAHLFKRETGIPLKNYMLMRQFEYAWVMIADGKKITDAVLDAGFGSSSHFSDVCQRMTGVSVMDVMHGKADL